MNKEQIKGKANQIKGAVKEAYGKTVGDTKTQASGVIDKVKGRAQEAVGDVEEVIDKANRSAKRDEQCNCD